MQARVVITGMGTLNALGLSVNETWENIIKGVSGVGRISSFDASGLRVQIACEVQDFDPLIYMSPREARRRDRVEQLAAAAVQEAIQNSGIEVEKIEKFRVGVIISSAWVVCIHCMTHSTPFRKKDLIVSAHLQYPCL